MFGIGSDGDRKLWAKVVQYYSVNFRSYEMHPHSHPAWEVMLVVSGTAQISYRLPGEKTTICSLHQGNFIVVDSGVEHRLYVERDCPCRMLNIELAPRPPKGIFSFENLQEFSPSLLRKQVILAHDRDACLHSCIISLQQQLKRDKEAKGAEVDWIIGQLLLVLGRQAIASSEKRGNRYVTLAEDYISLHYDGEITIEEIAAHAGLSRAYLQRLYKEQNQCSIIDRVNALRIDKAKFLLLSSSLSLIDVAINVGFNNRQHFSHVFQALVGCSPGEFRKKELPATHRQPAPSKLYSEADGTFYPQVVR